MQPRTKRQKEVLDYISRFVDRYGHGPSYQQIARHLGVSSRAGVQRHITALESLGFITRRRENGSFGIEITSRRVDSSSIFNVEMAETTETKDGKTQTSWKMLSLPKFMFGTLPPGSVVALKVPNDLLSDRGVVEGDLALFEKRNYARRGDLVLARLPGERLLMCRYYPQGTLAQLRLSDDVDPLEIASDEVELVGVFRGMMRPIPNDAN